eukprot:c17079_g1_i1.p1 GENE.c17079_g1_i1~~c17079_g1_i1.p1  ORF type:complete len:114 (+),score=14.71 c17079_g1_i1:2-343(+)
MSITTVHFQLYDAARNGKADEIPPLVKIGANIDYVCGGWTPLIVAANNAHIEAVRVLIEQGANLNARDTRCGVSDKKDKLIFKQNQIKKGKIIVYYYFFLNFVQGYCFDSCCK